MAGILLSLTGVCAIILAGSSQVSFGKTWKGDLLMMGAAFCWGWYSGASAGLLAKYGALRLTVLTMVLGTVVMSSSLHSPWFGRTGPPFRCEPG